MTPSTALRTLVLCLALGAFACGRPVPQATKDAAGTGTSSALKTNNQNTEVAANLSTLGTTLSVNLTGVSSGQDFTLDLSHVPAPSELPSALYVKPPSQAVPHLNSSISGCVSTDPNNPAMALFVASGTSGCAAAGQVIVTYDDGEQVVYGFTATSFGLQITGGAWNGTNVSYTVTGTSSDLSIAIQGTVLYDDAVSPIDTTFDNSWEVQTSPTNTILIINGSATDLIGLHKVSAQLSMDIQDPPTGSTSFTMIWKGDVTVDAIHSTSDPSVVPGTEVLWQNIDIRWAFSASATSFTSQASASGDVVYAGLVVGHLEIGADGKIDIRWVDGTTTGLDVSNLIVTI